MGESGCCSFTVFFLPDNLSSLSVPFSASYLSLLTAPSSSSHPSSTATSRTPSYVMLAASAATSVVLLVIASALDAPVSSFIAMNYSQRSPERNAAVHYLVRARAKAQSQSSAPSSTGSHFAFHSRPQKRNVVCCTLFASDDDKRGGSSDGGAPPPPPSEPLFDTGAASDAQETEDWSDFNPFQPVRGSSSSSSLAAGAVTAPGRPISLRAMRMKSITSDLYRENASPSRMDDILGNNTDFLIEQLVDVDCVLDLDSIYTRDMTSEERMQRYREVMDERVAQARNGDVKRVLVRLRDFVLEKAAEVVTGQAKGVE